MDVTCGTNVWGARVKFCYLVCFEDVEALLRDTTRERDTVNISYFLSHGLLMLKDMWQLQYEVLAVRVWGKRKTWVRNNLRGMPSIYINVEGLRALVYRVLVCLQTMQSKSIPWTWGHRLGTVDSYLWTTRCTMKASQETVCWSHATCYVARYVFYSNNLLRLKW